MLRTLQFTITDPKKKLRLDQFLYDEIGTVSRMFLANLIEQKVVFVNGEPALAGYHLQNGDKVEITFDSDAETAMTPENLPLEVVFEDAEIIIVNKPSGMLVHPSKQIKTGTLANALAFHLNNASLQRDRGPEANQKLKIKDRMIRPGLVHRLDKQTSGLIVAAKTPRAHRILSSHFERRLVKKTYIAVVEGIVEQTEGEIQAPIGRVDEKPNWRVLESGKAAESRFRVLEYRTDATLLELEPVTGRTNQLRIHCALIGHPIVGDQIYGGREFSRLCLHAAKLAFYHPNGGWLEFVTESPAEFGTI